MSMAGAFSALGGDLSAINQNPGGIGVYRSSDLGFTMGLDFNATQTPGWDKETETKFQFNNLGYVGSVKLDSEVMPHLNFGITFNRVNSFNRRYRGSVNNINSSLSNYIAQVTNNGQWSHDDLAFTNGYNPYYDSSAPWLSVLAYDSYLINQKNVDGDFKGLMQRGVTTGFGEFEIDESGHTDEYSIAVGGNINNMVYWGLGLGINDFEYDSYQYYGEGLTNAQVNDDSADLGKVVTGDASYGIVNHLSTDGTGYNFKLGVIVKPVNELRIGLAFHTPTFYDMRDHYKTVSSFEMVGSGFSYNGEMETGEEGYWDESRYTIKTPWRFMAGVAGVIGNKGIIDVDYEYVASNTMRVGDDRGHDYVDTRNDIKDYFDASHIIRVGGEYRITPEWSVRAGYSYQTSPVKEAVRNNEMGIITTSNNAGYEFDNSTQHITAGIGYHYKSFYADLAYVHKNRKSEYHAFSPQNYVDESGSYSTEGVFSEVKDNNNRVALTIGFRF